MRVLQATPLLSANRGMSPSRGMLQDVVVPASMRFKVRGTPVSQSGAVFTVALSKLTDGWRIAAWAWAKGSND